MIFYCQAILFDLDGVLVDSTGSVERVWRKWAVKHHFDPGYVIEIAHGRRSIETVRQLAPEADAERENAIIENMEIADREGVVALPGAAELLRTLPEDRFAIVTSGTRALATARLGYARLPVPQQLITGDDVVNGKPSPEPYLKGAELLGYAPGDCLVFEDAPAGVRSALAAGMHVIALLTTYPAKDLDAAGARTKSLGDVHASFADGTLTVTIAGQ